MTQFSQLELIYNRILNLVNEITVMIENEEYSLASDKLEHKNKLIKQLSNTAKTVNFTKEESLHMQEMESVIREKDKNMLDDLQKLKDETAKKINTTNNKIKLSSAYEPPADRQGFMIDITDISE